MYRRDSLAAATFIYPLFSIFCTSCFIYRTMSIPIHSIIARNFLGCTELFYFFLNTFFNFFFFVTFVAREYGGGGAKSILLYTYLSAHVQVSREIKRRGNKVLIKNAATSTILSPPGPPLFSRFSSLSLS